MHENEYQRLMAEARRRRDKLIAKAKKEYKESVGALDRVRKLSHQCSGSVLEPGKGLARGELTSAIEEAFKTVPDEFNLRDVVSAVRSVRGIDPLPSSVCSYLRRQHKLGRIREIEKGAGKRATRYAKIENDFTKVES
jgi:hypothetical protein